MVGTTTTYGNQEILASLILASLAISILLYIAWRKGLKIPHIKMPRIRSSKSEVIDIEEDFDIAEDRDTEVIEKEIDELKRRVLKEKERAKRIEEAYDELRVEYEKSKDEIKKREEELNKTKETIKVMEEESKKLAKFSVKRFNKGQYVPVILWTKRGNPMPYKYVVEIGWVNGGYRALLVDSITADPSTGKWFPDLNRPAPQFCFRDDPGFNPADPSHTVLFDINRYDWEEDLKVTQHDPHARPVAFSFGIDEDGNPIHKLQFGSALSINKLRAENRGLKMEVMRLMHMNDEMKFQINDLKYKLQMEKDLREHLEKELKLVKSQLFETRDMIYLMGDELEAAREAYRTQRNRRYAALRRAEEAEKLFDAYYGRTTITETPIAPYLEMKSKEKDARIVSILAPIARREASMYNIDKTGKSDEEIVDEWIKEKVKREGISGWLNTLKTLGLDMVISDIVKEGMI